MPFNLKKLLKNKVHCGHINYTPPEMLDDISENFSDKIDIWALGCCLYFLTSKEDPFDHANSE
jgi:serine/threonine protein kinase